MNSHQSIIYIHHRENAPITISSTLIPFYIFHENLSVFVQYPFYVYILDLHRFWVYKDKIFSKLHWTNSKMQFFKWTWNRNRLNPISSGNSVCRNLFEICIEQQRLHHHSTWSQRGLCGCWMHARYEHETDLQICFIELMNQF